MTDAAPLMADDRMVAATGRTHEEWFRVLDEAGATAMAHRDVAAHLQEVHGVDGWWAQSVTVAYERARGLRAANEMADGFAASKSKTIRAPVAVVYRALADDGERATWLDRHEALTVTSSSPERAVNGRWEDGTRVTFGLVDKGDRTLVAVQHRKLPDAEAVREAKAVWAQRLEALAARVAR